MEVATNLDSGSSDIEQLSVLEDLGVIFSLVLLHLALDQEDLLLVIIVNLHLSDQQQARLVKFANGLGKVSLQVDQFTLVD